VFDGIWEESEKVIRKADKAYKELIQGGQKEWKQ